MEKRNKTVVNRKWIMIAPFILVFCILGAIVFLISRKISNEMSQSAIGNLSESLDLLGNAIEALLGREAEFQKLIAGELAGMDDPDDYILSYDRNDTMVKLSLVFSGETEGISSTGDVFRAEELDFSGGKTVDGLPLSRSYINDMGTWAYTMKCPVLRDTEEIATFYVEYVYDSFDEVFPRGFYNNEAKLYLMDAASERLVLKPKGIGERDAGHMSLDDFYYANKIQEENIGINIAENIKAGKDIMFYHDILNEESLIFMWSVNGGAAYMIGYVPVQAIQREGDAVNQNIVTVVVVMLAAFFACCGLYLVFEKQHNRIQREREEERELYNAHLQDALQAAQAASHSKTMFLSNMSHDIRTPMNAVLGFSALLAKNADNPERVREYTKKITASGQHLLSLINDVLDISKIESGKAVLTMEDFTLKDMLSSVDAIIRPAAKAKKQNFEIAVSGIRNEHFIGDETRLNQVLLNLLSNAVKYTQEEGTIWLRIIGGGQHSSQYERVRIEVEDNGYGMSPEYLKTIFDAFTRAENSTTNKVQGTGLGMAITKNLVELMGGTIEVVSKEGEGSKFTVELELRIPEVKADRQFWEERGISRILVADEDGDVRESVRLLMEDMGICVDTACSGEEALKLQKSACEAGANYQIILLDWKIQKMEGAETARKLRGAGSEQVIILLLADYGREEIWEEVSGADIDGFLSKPFFASAFREKMVELFHEKASIIDEEEESIKGRHFLVAEDNEINSEILSEFLLAEGASCEVVENGKLAVERYEQAPAGSFDAILMDVQMPVMNGYEATRKIRGLEREDAGLIPIIAMTANAFAEDVKEAIDAGMNDHVAKPIDIMLLKKVISRHVNQ